MIKDVNLQGKITNSRKLVSVARTEVSWIIIDYIGFLLSVSTK